MAITTVPVRSMNMFGKTEAPYIELAECSSRPGITGRLVVPLAV